MTGINLLDYDAWIPGNHEFDFGAARFRELVASCRSTVLAANLVGQDLPRNIMAWRMFDRAGRRIAVIGMTSPHLDAWFMPAEMDGMQARSMRESLERFLPEVMAAKPDLVVLAIHHGRFTPARLGDDSLLRLARDYPQVHLVLGAHSHEAVPGEAIGRHGWFVQPGQHGEYLARIEVTWGEDPAAPPLIASRLIPTAAAVPDATFAAALRAAHPAMHASQRLAQLPVGTSPTTLAAEMGHAMCRAGDADFALVQTAPAELLPPGMRLDERALFAIMPYENHLWRLEVAPDDLAAILAEQARQDPRPLLLVPVAGATPSPEDASAKVALTVSNYALAGGGGRYPVLRRLGREPTCRSRPVGSTVREALRDHFVERFPGVSASRP